MFPNKTHLLHYRVQIAVLRDDLAAYSKLIGRLDHGGEMSLMSVKRLVFFFVSVLIINLLGISLPVIFRLLIILPAEGHANEPISDSALASPST